MSMMHISKSHEMIVKLAGQVADEVVEPLAAEADQAGQCSAEAMAALFSTGLVGSHLPAEYGGAGTEYYTTVCILERIAKACASTAALAAAYTACADAIMAAGSAAQKEKYLTALVRGAGITLADKESPAGMGALCCTAEKKDGGYVLSGTKTYVENAGRSAAYLVTALAEGKPTVFLVDGTNPGVRAGAPYGKLGLCACAVGELRLCGCAVGADAVVGGEGKAAKVLEAYEASQRLCMGAVSVGLAQGAMDTAIEYVNQRVQFKKTIAKFQNTQYRAAEFQSQVAAARALVYLAAAKRDAGADYAADAAMAKLFASDTAAVTTKQCVQFMGGFGYMREYPVERMMRDGKTIQLYGGRNEEQKAYIAGRIGVC